MSAKPKIYSKKIKDKLLLISHMIKYECGPPFLGGPSIFGSYLIPLVMPKISL